MAMPYLDEIVIDVNQLGQFPLTANFAGAGAGTITSNPAGMNCDMDCTGMFTVGTAVTLTAAANTGSTFANWDGDCSGNGDCVVLMDNVKEVTATFNLNQYDLNVTVNGNGSGIITSDPVGISCPADCTEPFDYGTAVTLTANYNPEVSALVWGGACSPATGDSCVVTIDLINEVTATFTLNQYSLGVNMAGNGSGLVTSDPVGINCQSGGGQCTAAFDYGTVVTLTAVVNTGSIFTGWSGACTGTDDCVVTMDMMQLVTATFTLEQFELSVTRSGSGVGSVISDPPGIDCGSDCTESYDYNSVITLTAIAADGSVFVGWSGACTGTAVCTITIDEAKAVTATFAATETGYSIYLPLLFR